MCLKRKYCSLEYDASYLLNIIKKKSVLDSEWSSTVIYECLFQKLGTVVTKV